MKLIHGGDVAGYRLRYGREPLDFSASLNPLGMPEGVIAAAREAVAGSVAYPDPLCRDLVRALARHRGLPERFFYCGNGAADVIYRLVQVLKPRRALLVAPSFAEYEQALAGVGCECRFHTLSRNNGFILDEGILGKITGGVDMVFLCQPNNPTGLAVEPELAAAMLRRSADVGAVLFADECFCHFLDRPEERSLARFLGGFPNLFILDSFTKLYGMAGLRLGYGMTGDRAVAERLHAAGQPWTVSTVAQAAGLAALSETGYVEESRRRIASAKRVLADGLRQVGCTVFGGDANYLFFHSSIHDLDHRLMRDGVLIRNCGNYRGLEPGYFRVAVRLEEENETLLQAMRKNMNG